MEENNGKNSAFPWTDGTIGEGGLTKREYFAGLAMQGLLSNPFYMADLQCQRTKNADFDMNKMCAMEANDMADALLKALDSQL